MTADMQDNIRASRRRVARSRGALSGIVLVILGAWAALVPFIGPYFNLAFTPQPNSAWHWTAARGWLEVLPGAAAFLGGLLLLFSASRATTVFGGWLAALGGAWLVVGPSLADPLKLNLGTPDPSSGTGARALEALLFFYAIGAAILFFASLAIGRVSVLSVRDVRAAERRAEAEQTERQAALEAAAAEQEARRREEARRAEQDGSGHHAAGAPNEPAVAGAALEPLEPMAAATGAAGAGCSTGTATSHRTGRTHRAGSMPTLANTPTASNTRTLSRPSSTRPARRPSSTRTPSRRRAVSGRPTRSSTGRRTGRSKGLQPGVQ